MGEETDQSTFGGRLKSAREARGLTQAELGALMETTNTVVSRWENDHGMPRHATAELLGALLGVEPAWLMFGTGRRNAPQRGLADRPIRRREKE